MNESTSGTSVMHPAYLKAETGLIVLCARVSEWLIATGFWRDVASSIAEANVRSFTGKIFGHYEETIVSGPGLSVVIDGLRRIICDVLQNKRPLEVGYGWQSGGEALRVCVTVDEVIRGCDELCHFLGRALDLNLSVEFGL